MTAREFFYLVAQVRAAQAEYFQKRDPQCLRYCRALEGELDREIDRVKQLTKTDENYDFQSRT